LPTNWADVDIGEVIKDIYLGSVENLKVTYNGTVHDTEEHVTGSYLLHVYNISGAESRTYKFEYEIPTGVSSLVAKDKTDPESGHAYIVYDVSSVAPIIMGDTYFESEDIDCVYVKDVVNLDTGEEYEYECGSTVVKLGTVDVGQRIRLGLFYVKPRAEEPIDMREIIVIMSVLLAFAGIGLLVHRFVLKRVS